jgi:hypothetical protein
MLEYSRTWTFTSTGAGDWEDAFHATSHQFIGETAAGSTATYQIEHRRLGSSITMTIGAEVTLDASTAASNQVTGAFWQVRPRVTSLTSTGTLRVQGVGLSGT